MLSGLMITGLRRAVAPIALLALSCLGLAGCERVPLLAPSGSTITLISSTATLPLNSTTTITAQVVEPAGTAPHSGTTVTFTTSLGTVTPAEAETDVNGRAVVTFSSGTASGVATILANSGGATVATANAIKIAIGAAAVGQLTLSANPGTVPNNGGSTTITASVFDTGGNALSGVPVNFVSDVGTIFPAVVLSDSTGKAQTTLTTTGTSKVTATAGSAAVNGTTTTPAPTATLTVTVTAAPQLTITPPSTPPGTGLPASFTFAVTAAAANGSAVRSVQVNWGDGTPGQNLGPIVGTSVQSHTYTHAGTFVITATLTDSAGNVNTYQTAIAVVPTSSTSINITASVPNVVAPPVTVTFQIQITPPTGVGIVDVSISFGDGGTNDLGGVNGSITVQHTYLTAGPQTVTATVTDTLGRTNTGTTFINVP
jgi:hypothetical protein